MASSTNNVISVLSTKSQTPTKPKRRNSDKRKEKSRNAARCRRGKETEIYYELAQQLPLSQNVCQHLDKAGIMRLCIAYLRTRTLLPLAKEMCIGNKENDAEEVLDSLVDNLYIKSLEGFLYVLSQEGDIVYLSENVSQYLGLTQVDLIGQSIYEFAHPCDHDEIRDQLSDKRGSSSTNNREHQNFLLRLKCTLTDKGKTVNLKSAIYKVVQCIGHKEWIHSVEYTTSSTRTLCLIVIASPIPHPSNIEHPLDSKTFVSRHNLDMTFTDCDERVEELLGYNVSEVESHSFYKFFHAADNEVIEKNLKDLYAKGQAVIGRYRFLAKDGGYAWISTEATIIYHNKTYKPQCIVCIHYMISGVEKEDEIVSLDQEVAKSNAKSKSKGSGNSPFVYWSPTENQTVEVDPSDLEYLAPTSGEVFVPLFSSTMRDDEISGGSECSMNYSEMIEGIGDDFMDFNPFAPMDYDIAEKQMSPQEIETKQNSSDVLHSSDPILPTEKYTSSSEDEGLDELGMNAPVILDESCQFTNSLLTDLDGICWDSLESVDPFSLNAMTGSVGEEDMISNSTDGVTESEHVNVLKASLSKMTGLSRSLPNMSIGSATMKTNELYPEPICKSVTPSYLDSTSDLFFSPNNYFGITQNLCDQRNVPPDILQGLPVLMRPRSDASPQTSEFSPQAPQLSSSISQVPLQSSLVSSQTSPMSQRQVPSQSSLISPQTSPMSQRQVPSQSSLISPQTSPMSQTQMPSQTSYISPQTSPMQQRHTPSQVSLISSQTSPMSQRDVPLQPSQISPQTSRMSPLQISPVTSQTSQISPFTSLISNQLQIIPTTSSLASMLSFPNIPMNYEAEKTPGPDWNRLEDGHPSLKLLFGRESRQTDFRILKRKLSIDVDPVKAKIFAKSTCNSSMPMKNAVDSTSMDSSTDTRTMSTVDLNALADILNQSGYNATSSNALTHSRLLQQVAMKANESSKKACNQPVSLFSSGDLISSSSMPLITQYDAEVNAPITSSGLLQGNDLLRALDQSKVET